VLVAAAFTLRVMQISFFGTTEGRAEPLVARHATPHAHPLPPITLPERAGALLLIAATVYLGLQPGLLLDWITPALQSPLFQAVWKGGSL
jgi:NADH-quinone oxidoreductase subunit M